LASAQPPIIEALSRLPALRAIHLECCFAPWLALMNSRSLHTIDIEGHHISAAFLRSPSEFVRLCSNHLKATSWSRQIWRLDSTNNNNNNNNNFHLRGFNFLADREQKSITEKEKDAIRKKRRISGRTGFEAS
jgi:hypothetical protein